MSNEWEDMPWIYRVKVNYDLWLIRQRWTLIYINCEINGHDWERIKSTIQRNDNAPVRNDYLLCRKCCVMRGL